MSFTSVQIRIVATYLESLTTSTTKDANPCDSELVLLSFVTRRKSKLRYRLVSSSNVVSALFGRSSSEVENPVRPSSSKSDARIWRSPQTISLSLHTSSSSSAYRQNSFTNSTEWALRIFLQSENQRSSSRRIAFFSIRRVTQTTCCWRQWSLGRPWYEDNSIFESACVDSI